MRWLVVIVGVFLCGFVVVAGSIALVVYLVLRSRRPGGSGSLERIIEDWAEENGYEVLEISTAIDDDHPFADRFGAGFGKRPGVVRYIEVRTRKGRKRGGHVYIAARLGPGGYSGLRPASLEVVWDD